MIAMLKYQRLAVFAIFLILLTPPVSSVADEVIEDKIYITESDSELNAVIEGTRNTTARLGPKEDVLWKDSIGYLGVVLTNDHFYVVSTTSDSWKAFRLKPEEAESAKVSLSSNIAILATGDRAVCYNISMNNFFEIRLPVRTALIAAEAGKHVAVVATTGKLFGIRKGSSSFTDIRLGVGEVVRDVDITDNKVVVRTSDRLLSFVADDTAWMEYRLN
jgi:hypothetical protein